MKVLGIESSGIVASVAIVEDSVLLGEYTINHKRTHSRTLMPMLDELKKNHKDRVVSTSCTQIIEEALLASQHQNAKGEGRLILHLNK